MAPTTFQDVTALLSAPAASAFIGGATGLAGSWLINWLTYRRDRNDKAKATLTAIKAEIASLIELMELGNYVKGIEAAIQFMEQSKQPYFVHVPIKVELFTRVYCANVSALGTLNEAAIPPIVSFYGHIHALVMDLDNYKQTNPPYTAEYVANLLELYKLDLKRLKSTIALGRDIQRVK